MALREQLAAQGQWLFRRRSYLPLMILALLVLVLWLNPYPAFRREAGLAWEIGCVALSFLGLGVRAATIGCVPAATSGRNTSGQVAGTLNTSGWYSVVRNPLYLGNYLTWLGLAAFTGRLWVCLMVTALFVLDHERIVFAEEEFLRLKFGEAYLAWSARTPAFIPRFRQWRAPELRFSLRNVLKREYPGFFAIVLSYTILAASARYFQQGRLVPEAFWLYYFAAGLAIYLVLRLLSKLTKALDVKGR